MVGQSSPPFETFEHVPGYRAGRLDLHCIQHIAILDEEINLVSALVPPKENRRWESMMEVGLHHLSDNVVLEQGPPQRVRKELVLTAYAQQKTGETGIVEIELWAFDDALIEVPMVGREQENDKAGLQDRNPSPSRVHCNSRVRCEESYW